MTVPVLKGYHRVNSVIDDLTASIIVFFIFDRKQT